LDFTQARLGPGLSASKSELELHRTVAEVIEELSHIYPQATLRHESTNEVVCLADANRLAQLVGNLVSNAVAHGDPSRPITISTVLGQSDVEISVHNHGAPIPAPAQATIFDAMTRGEKASASGRSVGLGLFIVRQIAKAHGGDAAVHSSPEHGTTFRVSFPRK
jgi:sigma-B regulation protein RsbU (phosphoserine phosphatase)